MQKVLESPSILKSFTISPSTPVTVLDSNKKSKKNSLNTVNRGRGRRTRQILYNTWYSIYFFARIVDPKRFLKGGRQNPDTFLKSSNKIFNRLVLIKKCLLVFQKTSYQRILVNSLLCTTLIAYTVQSLSLYCNTVIMIHTWHLMLITCQKPSTVVVDMTSTVFESNGRQMDVEATLC